MALLSKPIFSLLAGATAVIAHGHVNNLVSTYLPGNISQQRFWSVGDV